MALPPVFDSLRIPAIGAPLFIISQPDLVIAQCKAGIVGSFPALNARPGPVLEDWLKRITEDLASITNRIRISPPHPSRLIRLFINQPTG